MRNRGSSPLARGLRGWSATPVADGGIIPARAGFTSATPSAARPGPDHPRSRGVYVLSRSNHPLKGGSSPLARGLRSPEAAGAGLGGIIPARAGFTRPSPASSRRTRDHPRSRGVYRSDQGATTCPSGSSPLARGLQEPGRSSRTCPGIIPARAGFTAPLDGARLPRSDHPRSRGVYCARSPSRSRRGGSSPLARGLRRGRPRLGPEVGIIPARAGFTRAPGTGTVRGRDHPRSRGVYPLQAMSLASPRGSSPLARGLLRGPRTPVRREGIIPARAGFTTTCEAAPCCSGDHPRSRGVYLSHRSCKALRNGSSPLARGLLPHAYRLHPRCRIIPARAGFTRSASVGTLWGSDHPRSRGVYTCGSLESQRRGTLPDCVCLHCRPSARSAEFR